MDPAAPSTSAPLRPIWLSHHLAVEADRCVRVGDVHVCRRCLAAVVGFVPAALLLLSPWRDDLQAGDAGVVLAATIVAGIDFVQTVRGRHPYRARRVWLLGPFVGATMAWLSLSALRDGFGAVHFVLGGAALALLALVLARGTVVRSAA